MNDSKTVLDILQFSGFTKDSPAWKMLGHMVHEYGEKQYCDGYDSGSFESTEKLTFTLIRLPRPGSVETAKFVGTFDNLVEAAAQDWGYGAYYGRVELRVSLDFPNAPLQFVYYDEGEPVFSVPVHMLQSHG